MILLSSGIEDAPGVYPSLKYFDTDSNIASRSTIHFVFPENTFYIAAYPMYFIYMASYQQIYL